MATNGTPWEAIDNIVVPNVYTGLSLGLYTNTKNSLTQSSTLGDITEPSGTGYARISLGLSWNVSNGVVTYPSNQTFENTGGGDWTGAITGAFLTDGTYLLHFRDFSASPITLGAGEEIEVDLTTGIGV